MATVVNEKVVKVEQLSTFKDLLEEKVIVPGDEKALADAKQYTDDEIAKIEAAKAVYGLEKLESAEAGFASTYQLTSTVGETKSYVGTKINIPKDYLVKSATLETVTEADKPVVGYKVGEKYMDFVVNTVDGDGNESHIYLNVNDLFDDYEVSGDGLDLTNHVISLVAQDGSKDIAGITADDYNAFNDAINAVSVTGADTSAAVSGVNASTATTTYTLAGTTVDGADVSIASTIVVNNTTYDLAVEATEEAAAKAGLIKGEQVTQLNTATSDITVLKGDAETEGSVDYKIAQEAAKTTYATDDDISALFETEEAEETV